MADQYTTTTTSWFSRIKWALVGVFIAPICIIWAIILLWTNEGKSVRIATGLTEGAKTVISVANSPLDSALAGKLIYTTGRATTDMLLMDPDFWVDVPAIALTRKVEMYQWKEKSESKTQDNYGGSSTTTTTYTYTKDWSSSKIDSSRFNDSISHQNPSSWLYEGMSMVADLVKVGDIRLSDIFVSQIPVSSPVPLMNETLLLSGTSLTRVGDTLTTSKSPQAPEIGDIRISFQSANPQDVSVVGKLEWDTLTSYMTKNTTSLALLETGIVGSWDMFQHAQDANVLWTWIFRGIWLLIMYIGFSLIFQIIVILAKVLPPLATLIGWGTGTIAFILTLILGGFTIALAWLFARPLISGTILVIVALVIYFIWMKKKNTPLAPPTDMTPPQA